jgi:TPR repeat protein
MLQHMRTLLFYLTLIFAGMACSKTVKTVEKPLPMARPSAAVEFAKGIKHLRGVEVPPNLLWAHNHLGIACELQHGEACRELGRLYETGRGVTEERARAAWFYARACKYKSPGGCFKTGLMLMGYHLNTMNPKKGAMEALKKGCRLGSSNACFTMGYYWEQGKKGVKNIAKAAVWFSLSCKKKDIQGCLRLARLAAGPLMDLGRAQIALYRALRLVKEKHKNSSWLLNSKVHSILKQMKLITRLKIIRDSQQRIKATQNKDTLRKIKELEKSLDKERLLIALNNRLILLNIFKAKGHKRFTHILQLLLLTKRQLAKAKGAGENQQLAMAHASGKELTGDVKKLRAHIKILDKEIKETTEKIKEVEESTTP